METTERSGAGAAVEPVRMRARMRTPEDVAAMQRLYELGWGKKRIARELGCSVNTVRRHLRRGEWQPYKRPKRRKALDGQRQWLQQAFVQHRGNAAVVQQQLAKEHDIEVSLRTVERAVAPLRQQLRAQALATVRFETRPGKQMQADFGQCTTQIGGEKVRVHLCVLTLGYSRRHFAVPWPCERQAQWLTSFESAFRHFGGVTDELLIDNPRALVSSHNARTREVIFHPTFVAFCKHWQITPRACAPYRARTKGKDERAVGYVKRNAIAGHAFDSWSQFESHLRWWMREVADVRIHGTTGERPIDRFERDERDALRSVEARAPFQLRRTIGRRVHSDACVEVDTNHYSVPYEHIGCEVTVDIVEQQVVISRNGEELARHRVIAGKRKRSIQPEHLSGIVRASRLAPPASSTLARPLSVYEAIAGGPL